MPNISRIFVNLLRCWFWHALHRDRVLLFTWWKSVLFSSRHLLIRCVTQMIRRAESCWYAAYPHWRLEQDPWIGNRIFVHPDGLLSQIRTHALPSCYSTAAQPCKGLRFLSRKEISIWLKKRLEWAGWKENQRGFEQESHCPHPPHPRCFDHR